MALQLLWYTSDDGYDGHDGYDIKIGHSRFSNFISFHSKCILFGGAYLWAMQGGTLSRPAGTLSSRVV